MHVNAVWIAKPFAKGTSFCTKNVIFFPDVVEYIFSNNNTEKIFNVIKYILRLWLLV